MMMFGSLKRISDSLTPTLKCCSHPWDLRKEDLFILAASIKWKSLKKRQSSEESRSFLFGASITKTIQWQRNSAECANTFSPMQHCRPNMICLSSMPVQRLLSIFSVIWIISSFIIRKKKHKFRCVDAIVMTWIPCMCWIMTVYLMFLLNLWV